MSMQATTIVTDLVHERIPNHAETMIAVLSPYSTDVSTCIQMHNLTPINATQSSPIRVIVNNPNTATDSFNESNFPRIGGIRLISFKEADKIPCWSCVTTVVFLIRGNPANRVDVAARVIDVHFPG